MKTINTEWQSFTGKWEEDPCYVIYDDEQELGPGFVAYSVFHSLLSDFHEPIEIKRVKRIRYLSWDSYFIWMEKDRRSYKALQDAKEREQANA